MEWRAHWDCYQIICPHFTCPGDLAFHYAGQDYDLMACCSIIVIFHTIPTVGLVSVIQAAMFYSVIRDYTLVDLLQVCLFLIKM